jgi:hypothetical protein
MSIMHACAHTTTLQVGPHWAATYSFEVSKATDVCSTLRMHNQCECCTSTEFARCHPIFFFFHKMAHDMVFGIRCKLMAVPSSAPHIRDAAAAVVVINYPKSVALVLALAECNTREITVPYRIKTAFRLVSCNDGSQGNEVIGREGGLVFPTIRYA